MGMEVRVQGVLLSPVAICAYAARMPFCLASAYSARLAGGMGCPGVARPGALIPSASPDVTYTEVIGRPERMEWPVSGFMKNRSSSGWATICITDSLLTRDAVCALSAPARSSAPAVPPGQEATAYPAAPTTATAADVSMKCLRDGVARC